MPTTPPIWVSRRALMQSLETRRLLAVVSLSDTEGFPRDPVLTATQAYFSVVDVAQGNAHYTSLRRTDLKTGQTHTLQPIHGKHWGAEEDSVIRAGAGGIWIAFGDNGQLWHVTDGADEATPILSNGKTNGFWNAVTSPDASHLYFTYDQKPYISDGTAKGTHALLSVTTNAYSAVATDHGMLIEYSTDAAFTPNFVYADQSSPEKLAQVKGFTLDQFNHSTASPIGDGGTFITDKWRAVYRADAAFKKVDLVKLNGLPANTHVIDAAAIDGGIGYILSDYLANDDYLGEIWVSDPDGGNARRVGTCSEYAYGGERRDLRLLTAGSLFTIADAGDSGGAVITVGERVPSDAVLTGPGVYHISVKNGLTRVADWPSVDASARLSDGHSYAFGQAQTGGLIDVTDPSKPMIFADIEPLFTKTNGKLLVFTDGINGHQLLAYDPSIQAGTVTGVLQTRVAGQTYAPSAEEIHVASPIVYADLNSNSKRDAGEPSTTIDRENKYRLTRIPVGKKTTLRLEADSTQSDGIDVNRATVKVAADASAQRDFVLSWKPASIQVSAFDDLDRDGRRDANEPLLPGVHIFEDASKDGVPDSGGNDPPLQRRTNDSGKVLFSNVLLRSDRYILTTEDSIDSPRGRTGWVSVGAVPGKTTRIELAVERDPRSGALTIRPFRDRNADGRRRAGEAILPAGTFVSLYRNDKHVGDRVTDASGAVRFSHLYAGDYTFRFGDPTILSQASPVRLEIAQRRLRDIPALVASYVSGVAFRDANGDGVRERGEGVLPDTYVHFWELNEEKDNSEAIYDLTGVKTDAHGHYSRQLAFDMNFSSMIDITAVNVAGAYRRSEKTIDSETGSDIACDFGLVPETTKTSITLQAFIDSDNSQSLNNAEKVGATFPRDINIQLRRQSKKWYFASWDPVGEGLEFSDLVPGTYKLVIDYYGRPPVTLTTPTDYYFTVAAGEAKAFAIGFHS